MASSIVTLCGPAARADDARILRARSLFASAQKRLAKGSPEQRGFARVELEEARAADPADGRISVALGQLYLDADMLQRARSVLEDVLARDSANADAQFLIGQYWRRDWMVQADELSRDRAIVWLTRGVRSMPREFGRWCPLIPLLVDAGDFDLARDAAAIALRTAPANPEAKLLLAYTAQRMGDLAMADRLFREAIPRLPAAARARYEDLSPLVPPWAREMYEGMTPRQRGLYASRFWRDADPDPVSPENEAQLEFWARVTHARLLWGMTSLGVWDMRAQLYIRYGPPRMIERNSALRADISMNGTWLVWIYPELGMRVWMEATNPLAAYRAPFSCYSTLAMPYPDSIAQRKDLCAVESGWALFRRLAPTVQALDLGCTIARFDGDDGRRVLAQAESPGEPGDHLTAEWVVLDSALEVVKRFTGEMAPSACRPTQARAASFASALAPGRYRIGVAVTDEHGRRGVARRDLVVPSDAEGLELSDLVVTCGPPNLSVVPGAGVRLEPETGLFPAGEDQLNAYFEIYHLVPNADGDAQFEYTCSVSSAEVDRRSWLSRALAPRKLPATIEVSRRETTKGPLRRQYLSIPLRSLPSGRYRVVVTVRDVATGTETKNTAQFVRKT
jgi:GWxTD domain-containing protein